MLDWLKSLFGGGNKRMAYQVYYVKTPPEGAARAYGQFFGDGHQSGANLSIKLPTASANEARRCLKLAGIASGGSGSQVTASIADFERVLGVKFTWSALHTPISTKPPSWGKDECACFIAGVIEGEGFKKPFPGVFDDPDSGRKNLVVSVCAGMGVVASWSPTNKPQKVGVNTAQLDTVGMPMLTTGRYPGKTPKTYAPSTLPPDTTPPAVPTGLKAVPGDTTVELTWKANTESDLAGYNLYRDGVKVNPSLIIGAAYSDSGLTNDVMYSYTLDAIDKAGNLSAASGAVAATPAGSPPPPPPPPPEGLLARGLCDRQGKMSFGSNIIPLLVYPNDNIRLWHTCEPAKGVYNFKLIDDFIAAAGAKGYKVVLRIQGGWATPDHLMAAAGSFMLESTQTPGAPVERIAKWWTKPYLESYASLQGALAARYDNNPTLVGIQLAATMGRYPEILIRWPSAKNDAAYRAAGYTSAQDEQAVYTSANAMKIWRQTPVYIAWNTRNLPFGEKDNGGTKRIMDEVNRSLYGAGCAIMHQNHGLGRTVSVGIKELFTRMKGYVEADPTRVGLFFQTQTAARLTADGQSLDAALAECVSICKSYKGGGIELPTGYQSVSQVKLNQWNQTLKAS